MKKLILILVLFAYLSHCTLVKHDAKPQVPHKNLRTGSSPPALEAGFLSSASCLLFNLNCRKSSSSGSRSGLFH